MKKVKILLVTGLILVAPFVKTFGSGNENLNQAYSQLNVQLKDLLKQSLSANFDINDPSCLIVLTFSVNDKHQIRNIVVESNDDTYANYITKLLKHKKIEVDPLFDGKSGQMVITFESEG